MSTTMPSASRAARRKVASTTYVAPCSRCAGPNTSPRRLWAIIMWSRTVTLNTRLRPVVGDGVAEGRQAPRGQARHDPGELVEARFARDDHVEGGVAQEVEREGQAVGRRAAPGPGRGDRPDLAGAQPQGTRVERTAERQPHLGIAVPAQVEHRALGRQQLERALEALGRRTRVHDQVALAGGVLRTREAGAERRGDLGP